MIKKLSMNLKPFSLLASTLLLVSTLSAEDVKINLAEVQSYAIQKYRVDFNAQTDKSKQDILNEYIQASNISNAIANSIKDDVDVKVATKIVSIDIWANKYMATINPNEEQLKKLYETQSPKVSARYNLRNILLKDSVTADKLLKTLSTIKDKSKKLDKFKELVKSDSIDLGTKNKEGVIGFIDANKLEKNIQESLKDKKEGDIVKVDVANIGTQLLYVEEYQSERKASFEESKQLLVNLARQEALKLEINRLLEIQPQIK